MGYFIDLKKPLNKEDRAWLISRAREDEVAANDRAFGHLSNEEKAALVEEKDEDDAEYTSDREQFEKEQEEAAESEFDDDILDYVFTLDYNEVRHKLKELGEDATGTKEEVIPRLLNRLQDDADAKRKEEAEAEERYIAEQHK